MSARILALPLSRLRGASGRASRQPSVPLADPATLHFWRGASGRAYVHSVYPLYDCPPLPAATYVLVRRDGDGRAMALHVGQLCQEAPTLNLAQVRQQAATLGAQEVHVHLLAADHKSGLAVEQDLKAVMAG